MGSKLQAFEFGRHKPVVKVDPKATQCPGQGQLQAGMSVSAGGFEVGCDGVFKQWRPANSIKQAFLLLERWSPVDP